MAADLQPMAVAPRPPGDYAPSAGSRAVEAVHEAGRAMEGARILHVTVAGSRGRLPELIGGLLSIEAGAGVGVEWRVLFGDPGLRRVAGALHEGVRGGESAISGPDWSEYAAACARVAEGLGGEHDIVVLHDPGTLALAPWLSNRRVVWHCHVNAAEPEAEALGHVAELSSGCHLVLAPHESFMPEGFSPEALRAAPPGIDPLDSRNLEVEPRLPGRVVRALGVDLERPFCLQLLELDRWDDPHATIECFHLAREAEPELQLVLAAQLDSAASEEWHAAKEISDFVGETAGVVLLTSYESLGSLEVGALQHLARVVLERSLSEGFDLGPCEALWKRTPVVGGTGGGLPLSVRDGVDGYLTDDPEATAARLVELVRDPGLAVEMGRAGRERVREQFLVTAAAERELRLLAELL
jgi:trehalose synthase